MLRGNYKRLLLAAAAALTGSTKVCNLTIPCLASGANILNSFRVLALWFIDLTVATCHIEYTFLSLCQFVFYEKTNKTRKYSAKFAIFVSYENGRWVNTGAQSINTERSWWHSSYSRQIPLPHTNPHSFQSCLSLLSLRVPSSSHTCDLFVRNYFI